MRGTPPPVCCLFTLKLKRRLSPSAALLCLEKEPAAPLSIPETLTCDVYRLNPRVRLLGAVSRASASRGFGGTFSFKAKTKEKKVCLK